MGLWIQICGTFRQPKIFPATTRKSPSGDVIKLVFQYFERPRELGRCMLVCKLWRDILSEDDYIARCLITRYHPAFCNPASSVTNLRQLYLRYFMDDYGEAQDIISPTLSAYDLEFYIDIWSDDQQRLILSRAVPLQTLKGHGFWMPPPGIRVSDPVILPHLEDCDEFKLNMLLKPRLAIRRPGSITVSLLAGRRGSGQVASLIRKSVAHHVHPETSVAVASDDLRFSPNYPFVAPTRAWIALVLEENNGDEDTVDISRIEFGFGHVPSDKPVDLDRSRRKVIWSLDGFRVTEENVLKLLSMLDWK